ncbi:hypothetical protein KY326_03710 [Candidatus Woesearchaeota archaeon]|nr:hypothetical protein [Candidatus Woesearchaeota archaeon]
MVRDEEIVPGYSRSRDLDELRDYEETIRELRKKRYEINQEIDRVQFYFEIRRRLTEMGVWQEVITQIHDYQVLFGEPDDEIYDTVSLLRGVYFSVATVGERQKMETRGVPVKTYAYHFSWPEDPMPKLRGVFFKDARLSEVKRRFLSAHFQQKLMELTRLNADRAEKVSKIPGRLEKLLKMPEKASITLAP